jgi:hypothetical protein
MYKVLIVFTLLHLSNLCLAEQSISSESATEYQVEVIDNKPDSVTTEEKEPPLKRKSVEKEEVIPKQNSALYYNLITYVFYKVLKYSPFTH